MSPRGGGLGAVPGQPGPLCPVGESRRGTGWAQDTVVVCSSCYLVPGTWADERGNQLVNTPSD